MFLTWPNIQYLIDNLKVVFVGRIRNMGNLQAKLYMVTMYQKIIHGNQHYLF